MFRKIIIFLIIIIAIIVSYYLLTLSIPLVIALLTALSLNPLVRLFENRGKINRKLSVIIVFLLFLLVVGIAGTFLVTKAVGQAVNFVEDVPSHVNKINRVYGEWENKISEYGRDLPDEFVDSVTDSFDNYINQLSTTLKDNLTINRIANIFSLIPQYIVSILVYLIALFLFMLELPLLREKTYNLFTTETAAKVSYMNSRIKSVIVGFFKAQFLVSLIIFAVSLIGLFIIAPEVALIMSLIIWLIDLIPIIGSIIILGPWALIMFMAGDIQMGIELSILAIILLAIRRTVEPKVMGKHMGLSPLATLISMFLGLKLFGLLGFIIGPLIIIIYISAREASILRFKIKV
ncbi:sporulation integral membrane protein YtvI [Ornithinibacillus halotolerans]|uniref:Sporulation integral membrane protein YtvI n=1 Tax=Ornithinibacillus halotolerans TaxID=1274357 RepID=A0A916WBR2_9BACI|nr:sporulation integral membrane protein YtvI [Ornithinibacillus halotolerans]GGA83719.1 sporulation integral membrane protein YtvI [Ornithinibacillus halotolerans]